MYQRSTYRAMEAHETFEPGAIILLAGLATGASTTGATAIGVSGRSPMLLPLAVGAVSSPHPVVAVVDPSYSEVAAAVVDAATSPQAVGALAVEAATGPQVGTTRGAAMGAGAGASKDAGVVTFESPLVYGARTLGPATAPPLPPRATPRPPLAPPREASTSNRKYQLKFPQ